MPPYKATGANELFKSLSSSYLDGLANDTLYDQRVNEHYASMPRYRTHQPRHIHQEWATRATRTRARARAPSFAANLAISLHTPAVPRRLADHARHGGIVRHIS